MLSLFPIGLFVSMFVSTCHRCLLKYYRDADGPNFSFIFIYLFSLPLTNHHFAMLQISDSIDLRDPTLCLLTCIAAGIYKRLLINTIGLSATSQLTIGPMYGPNMVNDWQERHHAELIETDFFTVGGVSGRRYSRRFWFRTFGPVLALFGEQTVSSNHTTRDYFSTFPHRCGRCTKQYDMVYFWPFAVSLSIRLINIKI